MSVIDEVKQRADIVEIVGEYTSLIKAGRTFRALCPFHSEKNPSFFVYPERQSWHCFGACNTGGDVFSFVMKKQNIDFGEALRLLGDRVGVKIPSRFEAETGKDEKEKLYQINQMAAQYFHNLLLNSPAGEKARSYLASRGFTLKTIADFQLGFSLNSWDALKQYLAERGYTEDELMAAGLVVEGDSGRVHDRFRNKIMFPIFDVRGRVIGFGARVLDDSLPKYINSPQTAVFEKSSALYGINLSAAAIRQQDRAVIVEGYIDVITAHQNGFNNVIASMGTSVTESQISILKKLTKNIALALDADAAGEEAMLRGVGYENILDAEVKVILLPGGKDPDDVIKQKAQDWQRLLEEALPVVDYTFNMVSAEADLTTASGKSSVVKKLLPTIAEMKDIVRQAHYLQKLARLANVTESDLKVALNSMRPNQDRRPSKRTEKPQPEALARALHPLFSRPVEEYCLSLLLQHPELQGRSQEIPPEYFENSENREIFLAYRQTEDVKLIKEQLDIVVREYFDYLTTRTLPPSQIEEKYHSCVLRLREKFLRSLEAKREAVLALEAESKGTMAELTKLQEQGIDVSLQLGDVFIQKSRGRRGQRR